MSKFLTFEDRLTIEKGLRENLSFGAIAKEIGKDRTTIAKEIKKYAYDLKSGYSNYPYNACIHRVACKAKKYVVLHVHVLIPLSNVVYAISAMTTAKSLWKKFAKADLNRLMCVMDVANMVNVLSKSISIMQRMHICISQKTYQKAEPE